MADFFSRKQWREVSTREYDAYVVIEAHYNPDSTLRIDRVITAFPDASHNQAAITYARQVDMQVATVGTHLGRRANIYVIYFRPSVVGRQVMVFAEQADQPPVGTTGRARYLRTYIEP